MSPPSTKSGANPSAKPSLTGKPSINGGGPEGRPDDEGSPADLARHAAMAKYQACLKAHGSTLNGGFGFPRRDDGDPNLNQQPSLSAKDQAAIKACASLAPQFGGPGDRFLPRPTASPSPSTKAA